MSVPRVTPPAQIAREQAHGTAIARRRESCDTAASYGCAMRHPRLLLPVSLLLPALAACPSSPADTTDTDAGSTTDASSGSTAASEPTTTSEPPPPVLPTNRYFLRIDDTPPPPVVLEMDKAKALEIFGDKAAKEIKLIDVDSTALLTEVLTRIQNSCGDAWDDYVDTPDDKLLPPPGTTHLKYDCSKTELGKTYGASWKTSSQYAMVRLLTMTPRNAYVRGTEFDSFEALYNQNKNNSFGYSFNDILAASLFCTGTDAEAKTCTEKLNSFTLDKAHETTLHTRTFIPLDVLRETLKTTLLASHPEIANSEGLLPVTLYDALKDMQPLSEKLGPTGDHPGLLVPDDQDFTTYSDALTPAFKMIATAESNLRRVDGIDASVGAGEMFLSTAPAPLAFDFMDPQKVVFEGITQLPTVDMRMAITELPDAVDPCKAKTVDDKTCWANMPETPLGDTYIWSKPAWSLERIVAQAAYTSFATRSYKFCFFPFNPSCFVDVSIGTGGEPLGWSYFKLFQGFPTPPKQFLWEMLLGVAQEALHDPLANDFFTYDMNAQKVGEENTDDNIPEGALRPVFALKKVGLGLDADALLAAIREKLQGQADKIADVILGNFWTKNGRLDFYYRRASDGGPPYLFFVGPNDKRPDENDPKQLAAYTYKTPGFYSDAALTQKVSQTDIAGIPDTEHEKYQLPEGASTLYMRDDSDFVYQLDFSVPPGADPVEIVVRVTKL